MSNHANDNASSAKPTWRVQVRVEVERGRFEWRNMRPSNGPAYSFESEDEARRTADWCYPEQTIKQVRVIREGA